MAEQNKSLQTITSTKLPPLLKPNVSLSTLESIYRSFNGFTQLTIYPLSKNKFLSKSYDRRLVNEG